MLFLVIIIAAIVISSLAAYRFRCKEDLHPNE
jgi:hypothetical protein